MKEFNAAFDAEYADRLDAGIKARLELVLISFNYCLSCMVSRRKLTISDLLWIYPSGTEDILSSDPRSTRS